MARTARVTAEVDRELATMVATYLPDTSARIAVLSVQQPARATARIRQDHPAATVHRIHADKSLAHVELTRYGPFDLIVDDRPTDGGVRFLAAFYQLRPAGTMIIRTTHPAIGPLAPAQQVSELLTAALTSRDADEPPVRRGPLRPNDIRTLGETLDTVTVNEPYLVVVRGSAGPRPVLAKLREPEMNAYLSLTPTGPDRVLDTIPAKPFTSRCVFRENSEVRRPNFPTEYETIDISLRLYHDVVVSPGQLVSKDRFLTPDSFRHNQWPRLGHRYLDDVAPRFARLRHDTDDLDHLEGTYFHLDNEIRGHYGHLMTEQLSKFWAWPRAKAIDPSAKALVAINKGRELRDWELDIYAAGGIAPSDVVMIREPVRVERLIAGTPLLSNPQYVHPEIADTWRLVGDTLAAQASDTDLPTRFFCARRIAKRECHNAAEVEQIFSDRGFAIVYPEDYSLGDQVRLFRGASVIAGWMGSGMFNLCFADDPKRVVLIGSTAYTARNEYLIAALLGHQIDSIACTPDDPTSYQSTFWFDHDREGRYLQEVLDSLPH